MSGGHHTHGWSRKDALTHLDSADRRKQQNPQEFWQRAKLPVGVTLAEVGAGTGFFAIPGAAGVGPSGKVYAIDVSEDLVELLRERKVERNLPNFFPVLSTTEKIPLESAIADVVLMANVLHDVPDSTIAEAVRLLKPEGRFLNLDWKKTETPGGPPLEIRLTPAEAEGVLKRFGLRLDASWEFGPHHYVLEFRRIRA